MDIGESGEGVWDFKEEIGNSEVEKVANTLARQLRNERTERNLVDRFLHGPFLSTILNSHVLKMC